MPMRKISQFNKESMWWQFGFKKSVTIKYPTRRLICREEHVSNQQYVLTGPCNTYVTFKPLVECQHSLSPIYLILRQVHLIWSL